MCISARANTWTRMYKQLSIHPFFHPSIHPSMHPSVHPSIHPLQAHAYIINYIHILKMQTDRQTDRRTDRHAKVQTYIHACMRECLYLPRYLPTYTHTQYVVNTSSHQGYIRTISLTRTPFVAKSARRRSPRVSLHSFGLGMQLFKDTGLPQFRQAAWRKPSI